MLDELRKHPASLEDLKSKTGASKQTVLARLDSLGAFGLVSDVVDRRGENGRPKRKWQADFMNRLAEFEHEAERFLAELTAMVAAEHRRAADDSSGHCDPGPSS